jgi:hypothetical protein
MSDDRKGDTPAQQERIQARAYYLWESDGRPDGCDVLYWHRARELIELEDSAGAEQLLDPVIADTPTAGRPRARAKRSSEATRGG